MKTLSSQQTNKKVKHYSIETTELFSLVLMRYKNCLFQQEYFDLPTFTMPAAPRDTTDRIVNAIDFSYSNLQEDLFFFFFFSYNEMVRNWKEYGQTPKVSMSLYLPQIVTSRSYGVMVLDRYITSLSPLSHSILMEWCVYKHQEWYPLNCERILHFS